MVYTTHKDGDDLGMAYDIVILKQEKRHLRTAGTAMP